MRDKVGTVDLVYANYIQSTHTLSVAVQDGTDKLVALFAEKTNDGDRRLGGREKYLVGLGPVWQGSFCWHTQRQFS